MRILIKSLIFTVLSLLDVQIREILRRLKPHQQQIQIGQKIKGYTKLYSKYGGYNSIVKSIVGTILLPHM